MKIIINENQYKFIKEYEKNNIFYRGLQNEGNKNIYLETWTKNYEVAFKYAKHNNGNGIIVFANLTMNSPLKLDNEDYGSQINVQELTNFFKLDDLFIVLKNINVIDYTNSIDGEEISGLPRNSDISKYDVVIFDLIDSPHFSDLLIKNGFDSVIYYGWEGESSDMKIEYRVINQSQIKILKKIEV